MLDDSVFDGIADCLADGTLAYLKKQYAAGTSQSPWKISKTIQKACEALGEKLEKADIDIIMEEAGELTEEKLASRLLLRRVSDCMDRQAYQWLLEEMAERNISAAEVKSTIQRVAEKDGRKLGQYQVDDILTKIEEGMDADSIVEYYQNAVARIVKETDTFIDYLNQAGNTIRISKQSSKTIDAMIQSQMKSEKSGKRIEAKVADYINNDMGIDLTDFANKIQNRSGDTIGDIDCATEEVFIEVKKSVGSVKKAQFAKYVDASDQKFMNINQKKVVLYIDEPMGTLSGKNAEEIREIRAMGVTVVNSLEELKEVIELWEHPVSF